MWNTKKKKRKTKKYDRKGIEEDRWRRKNVDTKKKERARKKHGGRETEKK